jgi:hypothetical protein
MRSLSAFAAEAVSTHSGFGWVYGTTFEVGLFGTPLN